MKDNPYYYPETFGLSIVGCVDFSSGSWEFDYTMVWQDEDGYFLFADDSGCSCPVPFESHDVSDLTRGTMADIQAHLEDRFENGNREYERERIEADIVTLLSHIRDRRH